MLYTKEKVLTRVNMVVIVQFLGLAGLASVLPFYIHIQWITGPVINAILIIETVYNYFKDNDRGFFLGVLSGSVLKFLFLFLSVNIIEKLLIKQELLEKVADMMSWSQLATALTGGMIAFLILKWLKRI